MEGLLFLLTAVFLFLKRGSVRLLGLQPLHQYQREIKTIEVDGRPVEYIEVTLEDIDAANRGIQSSCK